MLSMHQSIALMRILAIGDALRRAGKFIAHPRSRRSR